MKSRCPACAEEGKDTSGNGLHTYPDGSSYCFKCRTYTSATKERKVLSKLTIEQVATFPYGTDPKRLISTATAEKYGVRYSVNGESGTPDTVYYPQYKEGVLAGYKVRGLPKTFKPSVGKIGVGLFGPLPDPKKAGSSFLILTEGEEDAMAAHEMLAGMSHSIVCASISNGTTGVKSLYPQTELLSSFARVYLCFDADGEGKKGAGEHADWLATVCKEVRVIELDKAIGKDASDYHMLGRHAEFKAAVKAAKVYEPEGIVNGTDIPLADLLVPMSEGYAIPFEGLHEKLGGLRKGEIVTICAGSGIGKSTLAREMVKCLIDQGASVANIALEDQMGVAAQALMALDMNIPLPIFRKHPPSEDDTRESYEKYVANGYTYYYKHFAGITADSLMNKLNYYAKSKKVDFIMLDHLSLVISASRTQNERQAIDYLMTDLAKLVVETGVGLIQIVHLRRTGDSQKSFAKGGEVELTDLRGSAALEQLSWAVIGLERDQQGDDRDFSRIRVLKNRTWGFTGLADSVKFDPLTGRMNTVKMEVPTPAETDDADT